MRNKPQILARNFKEGTIRLGLDGKTRYVAKKGPKLENRWYKIRAQETDAEDIALANPPKEHAHNFKPGTIRKGHGNHIKFIVKLDDNDHHFWYRIRSKNK
jgi:hypothetical protein